MWRTGLALAVACASCKTSPLDDWAKRPMKPVLGSTCIPGAPHRRTTPCDPPEGTRFSITLPEGLERSPIDAEFGMGGEYGNPGDDGPLVTVERCDSATREAWKQQYANFIDEEIDRDDALPDGFLVTSHVPSWPDSSAIAIHIKGTQALCCHAFFLDHDHDVGAAARDMLATICRSLAFR